MMAADAAGDYWSEEFGDGGLDWSDTESSPSAASNDVWMPGGVSDPWTTRDPEPGTWPIAMDGPDAPWRRSSPAPGAPPWFAEGAGPGLPGGEGVAVAAAAMSRSTDDLSDLRDALADYSRRLDRQIDHQRQLEQQLASARAFASEQSLQARNAETRIAQLSHELAAAREELANLRALEQGRTDRIVHLVEESNVRLVDQIRMGATAAPPQVSGHRLD